MTTYVVQFNRIVLYRNNHKVLLRTFVDLRIRQIAILFL
jgi:hypothetical protein